MKRVTEEVLRKSLGFDLPRHVSASLSDHQLMYEDLNQDEFNSYILKYLKTLDTDLKAAGEHRINDWESGWGENLKDYLKSGDADSLTPKYHTKSNISKLDGKIIKTQGTGFDFRLHSLIVDSVLDRYSEQFDKICEFGCGTGYHLLRLSERVKHRKLFGLDWSKSSQEILREISIRNQSTNNIYGHNFDYFKPDYDFDVNDSLVYTIASLEQIGTRHEDFLKYILDKKPSLCVHMEPISEVFDENNLLDYLNIKYFEKRNYLKGFLTKLKSLEKEGKAKIIEERRLNYGSEFIEGHTLIIWKPV